MKISKSQEGSVYWGYITSSSNPNAEGRYPEDPEANPDSLSDTTNVFAQPTAELTEDQEEALNSYFRLVTEGMLKLLSPVQGQVWGLTFDDWMDDDEIAEELKMTPQAVHTHRLRAAKKVRQEILKDLRRKEIREGRYLKSGFKKREGVVGRSSTDAEFEKRIANHQTEIDEWIKNNEGYLNEKDI